MDDDVYSISTKLISSIDDITTDFFNIIFKEFKETTMNYIYIILKTKIKELNKIIKYYKSFEKDYKSLIFEYEFIFKNITTLKNKDIIKGIYEIIESQLNQINDYKIENLFNSKVELITQCLEDFEKYLDNEYKNIMVILSNLFLLNSRDIFIKNENYDDILHNIESEFKLNHIKYFKSLYDYFFKIFKNNVDNLTKFETVATDLFKNENIILQDIINIQLPIIETEFVEKNEMNKLKHLMDRLKIIYFYNHKNLNEIEKNHNNLNYYDFDYNNFYIEIVHFNIFDKLYNNNVLQKKFENINITYFKSKLKKAYKHKLFNDINQLNSKLYIYYNKKIINQASLFCDEIKIKFENIDNYFINNKEELILLEQKDILNGVSEIIKIKINSLYENKNDFNENCSYLINTMRDSPVNMKEVYINELSEEYFNNTILKIIKEKNIDEEKINNMVNNDINSCYSITKNYLQVEKISSEVLNKTNCFLKEVILFEISTFEEVYRHSINILKESDNIYIKNYIEQIDLNMNEIYILLNKNDIYRITPNEHDIFNSKEHEVLIAEKRHGFNKGEIIKVLNNGYMKKGIVILRANVIAAR